MSASPGRAELDGWLAQTRIWVDAELERAMASLATAPAALLEGMRYSLFAGGKRLRPALVRLGCGLVQGDDTRAQAPAAAVELMHTYSLVHDDLPCMDDDDLRRGRPTCHKVYGEAMAVLVGDGLQALAFDWLARGTDAGASGSVAILARAAGALGMVGGQALDLAASSQRASADEVRAIHASKTGALIAASLELGGLVGGSGPGERARLRELGGRLGACFQAVDDLLDVTGDAASLGKTPGKDRAHDKATLVAALGLAGARAEAARLAEEAEQSLAGFDGPAVELARALITSLLGRRS